MRAVLGSRVLRTFLVTHVLLGVQFWFPVWLLYLLDVGFPIATAMLADAVFRLVSVACELPAGLLADRIGRRRSYLLLAGGTVVVFVLVSQVAGVGTLMVAWVAWGVLWAFSSGTGSAYLYELALQEPVPVPRTQVLAVAAVAGNVSVLVSLVAAGFLHAADPRAPFLLTAALALVALVVAYRLPPVRAPHGAASRVTSLAEARRAAGLPHVRLVVGLGAVVVLVGWSVRILFQPLALDLDLSPVGTGWMYAGYAAAAALGGLLAGRFGATHRRATGGGVFLLVRAAGAGTAGAPGLGPVLLLPLMGLGYAAATTVLDVTTNEVTPAGARATAFSAVAVLAGLGIAVARPGLGVLGDTRSPAVAFAVWALAGVLLLPVVLRGAGRLPPSADLAAGSAGTAARQA